MKVKNYRSLRTSVKPAVRPLIRVNLRRKLHRGSDWLIFELCNISGGLKVWLTGRRQQRPFFRADQPQGLFEVCVVWDETTWSCWRVLGGILSC